MPCSTFHLSCSLFYFVLFCFPFFLSFFFNFVCLFLTAIAMNKSWLLNIELIWDCFSSFLNFQNIYTETLAQRKYLLDVLLTSSP